MHFTDGLTNALTFSYVLLSAQSKVNPRLTCRLTLSEMRSKNFTSVKNQCKRRSRETLWKGFDLKSATAIRKTDLDGSYALSASANKIDGAYADIVRLQFRKFKREDKSRKAKQSRSKRERAKKRKPRLNKKDEPVIREVIRDKDKGDINASKTTSSSALRIAPERV